MEERLDEMNKHKIFISYYHMDDQKYKNRLVNWNKKENIFDDYSVSDGDIQNGLPAEEVRQIIRDDFIKDSTVLVLLCGKNTKKRKYIDWELQTAMYSNDQNNKLGILIINLPYSDNDIYPANKHESEIITNKKNKVWPSIETEHECRENFPELPNRIIENLPLENVNLTIVDWERIYKKKETLMDVIDGAYRRRNNQGYDTSTPLKKENN